MAYLKNNPFVSVGQLYTALRVKDPSLTEAGLTDLVWRMVDRGQADVEDIPPATKSLRQYLGFWERNLGLYISVAVSLVTVLVIYTLPSVFPLVGFRWILGSLFVLLIPGYVTVEALFPKGRDLDGIERFALSVGLSLALVPLIGLLLSYTPWGIRLDPIVVSLTILTIGLTLMALGRRFRMSLDRADLEATRP